MSRTNQILAVVLVVQLIIVGVIYLRPANNSDSTSRGGGALLADFSPDQVNTIRLENNEGTSIEVRKNTDGGWVLPSADDYPVRAEIAAELLEKLDNLQANRLVAQNTSNHTRLQVATNTFNRKITLTLNSNRERQVYVGSTVGTNAVHVRVGGSDDVYLVSDFAPFDVNPSLTNWIDSQVVSLVRERIDAVTLQNADGVLAFVKQADGTWAIEGLAPHERINDNSVNSLLSSLTSIRMLEPIGREVKEEYGLAEPLAVITIRVQPEATEDATDDTSAITDTFNLPTAAPQVYTLTIGAATDNGYYMQWSESDYVLLVSPFTGNNFVPKLRADYVIALAVQILG